MIDPAGGRRPLRVRRTAGLPLLPTTFFRPVGLESRQPVPPGGEADFLPTIPIGTRRMVIGLRSRSRGATHGSACSGHALALCRDT